MQPMRQQVLVGNQEPQNPQVLVADALAESSTHWAWELQSLLAKRRIGLARAGTGSEAMHAIRSGRVDLAVLALDRFGFEDLNLLRLIRSLQMETPCVLVADDANRAALQSALALKALSVFRPPIQPPMMAEFLIRILDRRASQPS